MSQNTTKPNKWPVCPAKTQFSLAICPAWDQPWHLPSLWPTIWSESSLCALWLAKDPNCLLVDSEDLVQTGQVPRLILVTAGSTGHFVRVYPPKYLDTWKNCCNYVYPKFEQCGATIRVMSPKDADRMANSVDPDQSDLGLHCTKTYRSLQYMH